MSRRTSTLTVIVQPASSGCRRLRWHPVWAFQPQSNILIS